MPELIPVSKPRSDLGYFYSPLDGMLVHHRATPSSKFPGTHLYTWVEKGTTREKCLAQEHNTVPQPGLEPGHPLIWSSSESPFSSTPPPPSHPEILSKNTIQGSQPALKSGSLNGYIIHILTIIRPQELCTACILSLFH